MRISLLTAAILTTSIANAATPVDGWYSQAFAGYTFIPENVSKTVGGLTRDNPSYRNGFNAGGRLGYKSNPLRYEGEFTYIQAYLKHFDVNSVRQTGASGSTYSAMLMANVYYDFPEMIPCVAPFLGVGLGYAHVQARLNGTGPARVTRFQADDTVFAYQGTAGFTYNFAENYAVNISYRFAATERPDKLGKVYQAHIGSVGVIYRFNESSYK